MWNKAYAIILVFPFVFAGCSGQATEERQDPSAGPKNPASVESGSVTLDGDNTKIGFVGTKPDGSHQGGFNELSGTITVDPESKAVQKISVEIQTESLWADDEKLTNHLKSADFFNVKERPTASFESSKIESNDAATGQYTVTGDLTLLDVSREISFPATVTQEDGKFILTSEFTIDRTDFGMDYGQGKVDNEVTLRIAVGGGGEESSAEANSDQ